MNWSERTRALLAKATPGPWSLTAGKVTSPDGRKVAEFLGVHSANPISAIADGIPDAITAITLRNDAEKLCVLRDKARKVSWIMRGHPGLTAEDLAALAQLDDAIYALDKSASALG